MQRLVLLAILSQGATALVLSQTPDDTSQNEQLAMDKEIAGKAEVSEVATVVEPVKEETMSKEEKAMNKVPWNDNTVAKPVFYTIIMGKRTLRHQVSLWYNALRKIGHWGGVAVIASDRADCVAKSLKNHELIGEKLSSSETVDIYGLAANATGSKGYLHIVKRPVAEDIPAMKLERARAWLNVREAKIPHPVSSIIYTDADVVIGESLALFYSQVRKMERNAKNTLAVFRDTSKQSMGQLHTAVVVMFPGLAGEKCLEAWGDKIKPDAAPLALAKLNAQDTQEEALKKDTLDADTFKEDQLLDEEIAAMGPDQLALDESLPCKKADDHDGIRVLPGHFLWLPTPKGISAGVKHTATFEHFTNDGRWKKIRHADIMEYLWSIGVQETINPMGKIEDHQCLTGHSQ